MQGFDYANQMTVVRRHHEDRLAEARREQLVRAVRDQRTGARFDDRPVTPPNRLHGLTAWLSSLGRTSATQAG